MKAFKGKRVFLCGGRAVIECGPQDFRVVCATCGAGGSRRFKVNNDTTPGAECAARAAVRDSGTACRSCGAH